MMERTAGFEPAFSTPFTARRFVAGVGYVRISTVDKRPSIPYGIGHSGTDGGDILRSFRA